MSAFVQSRAHIAVLVEAAIRHRVRLGFDGGIRQIQRGESDEIGQMLENVNVTGVRHLYPDCPPTELPGLLGDTRSAPFSFERSLPPGTFSAMQILMAVAGYEYEACEHPDWENTRAKDLCEGLRSAVVRRLPGWNEANTWSIPASGSRRAGSG